jgi:hypothetical protein
MKEILKQFEYLPMLSEFCSLLYTTPIEDYLVNTTFHNLKAYNSINEYTRFITQPLTKGMFVPCDEDGNVLEELSRKDLSIKKPKLEDDSIEHLYRFNSIQFQQAKDRVLFEGDYTIKGNYIIFKDARPAQTFFFGGDTIEDAINAGVKLKLKGWR